MGTENVWAGADDPRLRTTIPNSLANDNRLSIGAVGLMTRCFVRLNSGQEVVTLESVTKGEHPADIARAWVEIVAAGYDVYFAEEPEVRR